VAPARIAELRREAAQACRAVYAHLGLADFTEEHVDLAVDAAGSKDLGNLAANFRRAMRTLGQDPSQILLVGGPAGDEELLDVLARPLPTAWRSAAATSAGPARASRSATATRSRSAWPWPEPPRAARLPAEPPSGRAAAAVHRIPGGLVSPIRLTGPNTWATAGQSARNIWPTRSFRATMGYQNFRLSHIFRLLFRLM
jgi:hypothetical protein